MPEAAIAVMSWGRHRTLRLRFGYVMVMGMGYHYCLHVASIDTHRFGARRARSDSDDALMVESLNVACTRTR